MAMTSMRLAPLKVSSVPPILGDYPVNVEVTSGVPVEGKQKESVQLMLFTVSDLEKKVLQLTKALKMTEHKAHTYREELSQCKDERDGLRRQVELHRGGMRLGKSMVGGEARDKEGGQVKYAREEENGVGREFTRAVKLPRAPEKDRIPRLSDNVRTRMHPPRKLKTITAARPLGVSQCTPADECSMETQTCDADCQAALLLRKLQTLEQIIVKGL
ncbi:hypothetical protein CYMTET_21807 [Cymbomonas tetramitiformis]|uniref:Uncharacterized protein n=1 Tax=Cymbomonas tetramitiformis TaxID=36881 RepID=A0AAE0L2X4_9CHLO|nr:hypothetical protein CYMTET_21807 [Cymbomonas tetramitiformis]